MKALSSFLGLILAGSALACPPTTNSRYHKPMAMAYFFGPKTIPNFNVDAINAALDRVEQTYVDYLRPAGIEFSVRRYMDTKYKNAHPAREESKWFIDLYGGLFDVELNKYPSTDYAILVACHEVGHHLGGTVYYPAPWEWAAGEGQSDYYSTLKCMRKVLGGDDNVGWIENFEAGLTDNDPHLKSELVLAKLTCAEAWSELKDAAICVRSTMAAVQFGFNLGSPTASVSTPDTTKVTELAYSYPSDQCRLDSFVSGARCSVDFNLETDMGDHKIGNCDENEALGVRPACWFTEPKKPEPEIEVIEPVISEI